MALTPVTCRLHPLHLGPERGSEHLRLLRPVHPHADEDVSVGEDTLDERVRRLSEVVRRLRGEDDADSCGARLVDEPDEVVAGDGAEFVEDDVHGVGTRVRVQLRRQQLQVLDEVVRDELRGQTFRGGVEGEEDDFTLACDVFEVDVVGIGVSGALEVVPLNGLPEVRDRRLRRVEGAHEDALTLGCARHQTGDVCSEPVPLVRVREVRGLTAEGFRVEEFCDLGEGVIILSPGQEDDMEQRLQVFLRSLAIHVRVSRPFLLHGDEEVGEVVVVAARHRVPVGAPQP